MLYWVCERSLFKRSCAVHHRLRARHRPPVHHLQGDCRYSVATLRHHGPAAAEAGATRQLVSHRCSCTVMHSPLHTSKQKTLPCRLLQETLWLLGLILGAAYHVKA